MVFLQYRMGVTMINHRDGGKYPSRWNSCNFFLFGQSFYFLLHLVVSANTLNSEKSKKIGQIRKKIHEFHLEAYFHHHGDLSW